MKLDNKGWGLTEMIVICCGLVFCLLIAIYYINSLNGTLDKEKGKPTDMQEDKENNGPTDLTGDNQSDGPTDFDNNPPTTTNDTTKYEDYLITIQKDAITYALDLNVTDDVRTFVIPLSDLITGGYSKSLEDCDGRVEVNKNYDEYSAAAYITCSNFSNER